MPAWRKPEAAKAALNEINSYLLSRGFSREELDNLIDHRMVLVVHDAVQFRKLGKNQGDVRKQLKKLKGKTKTLPSGARREKQAAATQRRSKAWARLQRSGSVDDAASVIEGLL